MKVWITKYALTEGIIEAEAVISCVGGGEMIEMLKDNDNGSSIYYHGKGKEWHESLEGAMTEYEKMRNKRINSLQRQIDKLISMKVKVVKYTEIK